MLMIKANHRAVIIAVSLGLIHLAPKWGEHVRLRLYALDDNEVHSPRPQVDMARSIRFKRILGRVEFL